MEISFLDQLIFASAVGGAVAFVPGLFIGILGGFLEPEADIGSHDCDQARIFHFGLTVGALAVAIAVTMLP